MSRRDPDVEKVLVVANQVASGGATVDDLRKALDELEGGQIAGCYCPSCRSPNVRQPRAGGLRCSECGTRFRFIGDENEDAPRLRWLLAATRPWLAEAVDRFLVAPGAGLSASLVEELEELRELLGRGVQP